MSSTVPTRQKILASAMALIRRRKSADVSLGQIAAAAKVSRQAIYLHFRDRADLLVALIRHIDDSRGLPQKIRKIEQASSGREALRELVALQAADNPVIWPIARVFDAVRRMDTRRRTLLAGSTAAPPRGMSPSRRRLASENALRKGLEPDTATDILWTLTSLRMWEDLVILRQWPAVKYQHFVCEMLNDALLGCQ